MIGRTGPAAGAANVASGRRPLARFLLNDAGLSRAGTLFGDLAVQGGFSTEILQRIEALAAISEDPAWLTRVFLSPEHRRANALVQSWMSEAGMATRSDAVGNMIGRYEGERPGLPALVLGSHLDTVRKAGKYDGMLGVVTAIACVAALHRAERRLPFAVEVIGFADEEGVRFGATMLGSRAVAGTFDSALLDRRDGAGVTMAQALHDFGCDPTVLAGAAMAPRDILAYAELHIEQGPVLEARGLPVGCVTSINGASRFEVDVVGTAGHAGTVPMATRRDALAAAAQCVLAIEQRCRGEADLVGTVGVLQVSPGAINVIPGEIRFAIDLRAPHDAQRRRAEADVLELLAAIGRERGVAIAPRKVHDLPAAACAPWLMAQIDRAIAAEGVAPLRLPSGAGHDGMAMIAVAEICMIFVRCAGGISHNPAEAITAEDAEIAARVLLRFITDFEPKAGP
ncbi:MAG: allantoate amidohydrolase [Rhodospirillales bacterium]|nr:allantoate amidohydrolase [Rhodospirillales bacterium]